MSQNPRKVADPSAQTGQVIGEDDNAEYCRARAQGLIQTAIDKPIGDERTLLERSAAAWSMRAGQLQRRETKLAAEVAERKNEADDVRL